jgi:hypothetical protein
MNHTNQPPWTARAEALPDHLALDDLLALDLTDDEALAVLQGQPQAHRDEIVDRLALYRRGREEGRP